MNNIDDFFLKGSVDRIEENNSFKVIENIDADDQLDNYKNSINNYNIWVEYDFNVFLMMKKIINYFAYKSSKKAA